MNRCPSRQLLYFITGARECQHLFFKIFNIFSTEGTIPGSTDEKSLFFLDFKPFLQAQPIQEQIVAVEPGQDTALGSHF